MFFYGADKLMKLQGKIRVRLMELGVDEELAGECAEEALHIFATSDVVKGVIATGYERSLEGNGVLPDGWERVE